MTTNARDEKWSSWIEHDGKSVPIDDQTEFQYRLRCGTENNAYNKASDYKNCFINEGDNSDIIAYRYKIKEPETTFMHEDLLWLAKNVSEWPDKAAFIKKDSDFVRGYNISSQVNLSGRHCWTSHAEWQAARQQLGLDDNTMTESEEELPAEEWAGSVPEGAESEGRKYDSDKPAMDLIPPYMEEEVGMVLAFGAHKYAPDNWRKVTPLRSRYLAAAQRHINALKKGEQMDPESGLHHAAHAVCCLMFLGEVELEPAK